MLLLHEGSGQDDNVRTRADRLAALGYVAFALDYLGGGTQHPLAEAQARLGALFGDPAATGELALAGYRILTAQPGVDGDRLAAAGFCFGGVMALELARRACRSAPRSGSTPASPILDPPTAPASRPACS